MSLQFFHFHLSALQSNLKSSLSLLAMFLVQRLWALVLPSLWWKSSTWHRGCQECVGVPSFSMCPENADLHLFLKRDRWSFRNVRIIQFQNPLAHGSDYFCYSHLIWEVSFSNLELNQLEEWRPFIFCFMSLCVPMSNAFQFLQQNTSCTDRVALRLLLLCKHPS